MQWNCPHCGTKLTIADDALGSGWSFSRCYKCAGFALIRKAEINVIKVDKAPPGENIILPEATLSPTQTQSQILSSGHPVAQAMGLISENATRNLAKHIEPETSQQSMPPAMPSAIPPMMNASGTKPGTLPPNHQVIHQAARPGSQAKMDLHLPDPLPEIPFKPRKKITLPVGIVAASVLAIVSGIYFYLQAQTLWEKARSSAPVPIQKSEDHAALLPNTQAPELMNLPAAPFAPVVPIAAATPPQLSAAPLAAQRVITDQIQETATAPMKNVEAPRDARLVVQVRARRASVHTGPGMEYPVIGTVNGEDRYSVIDWSDRWFKLQIQNSKTLRTATNSGWVRNDLVKVIPENNSGGAAMPQVDPSN